MPPVGSTPEDRAAPDAAAVLGDRFAAVSRRLRRGLLEDLEPLGITPHEGRALRVAAERGPLRLGALADELRVAPRSVTDVVDALEARGLARRTPDPGDRRAKAVEVTELGRERVADVERLRARRAERLFGTLDAADRRELSRLLDLLLRG